MGDGGIDCLSGALLSLPALEELWLGGTSLTLTTLTLTHLLLTPAHTLPQGQCQQGLATHWKQKKTSFVFKVEGMGTDED